MPDVAVLPPPVGSTLSTAEGGAGLFPECLHTHIMGY